jgi:predicted RNase H-like HicB family nuclease
MLNHMKYVIYQEGEHYVAQCLNVDVSSFGETLDEAAANIKEAVELYFEDHTSDDFITIPLAMIGDMQVNV